jgi:hypothetical protein
MIFTVVTLSLIYDCSWGSSPSVHIYDAWYVSSSVHIYDAWRDGRVISCCDISTEQNIEILFFYFHGLLFKHMEDDDWIF